MEFREKKWRLVIICYRWVFRLERSCPSSVRYLHVRKGRQRMLWRSLTQYEINWFADVMMSR